MKTFSSMGEATLLAYEGERAVALAIASGVRRLMRRGLAWLVRVHAHSPGEG